MISEIDYSIDQKLKLNFVAPLIIFFDIVYFFAWLRADITVNSLLKNYQIIPNNHGVKYEKTESIIIYRNFINDVY